MFGYKQRIILETIKEKGRISTKQVETLYYGNSKLARNILKSLEMAGVIRLSKTPGMWVKRK